MESAIALVVLVVGFAGVIETVSTVYTEDRWARAARAAARLLALNPSADACPAIRREADLADNFDCHDILTVSHRLSPSTLAATLDGEATDGTGDMVLVRIAWAREPWSISRLLRDENTDEDTEPVSMVAMGLARSEPGGG